METRHSGLADVTGEGGWERFLYSVTRMDVRLICTSQKKEKEKKNEMT